MRAFTKGKAWAKFEPVAEFLIREGAPPALRAPRNRAGEIGYQALFALLKQSCEVLADEDEDDEKQRGSCEVRLSAGVRFDPAKYAPDMGTRISAGVARWQSLYADDMQLVADILEAFPCRQNVPVRDVLCFVKEDVPAFCEAVKLTKGEFCVQDIVAGREWAKSLEKEIHGDAARIASALLGRGLDCDELRMSAGKVLRGLRCTPGDDESRDAVALLVACCLCCPGGRAGPSNHYLTKNRIVESGSEIGFALRAAVAVSEVAREEAAHSGSFGNLSGSSAGVPVLQRIVRVWASDHQKRAGRDRSRTPRRQKTAKLPPAKFPPAKLPPAARPQPTTPPARPATPPTTTLPPVALPPAARPQPTTPPAGPAAPPTTILLPTAHPERPQPTTPPAGPAAPPTTTLLPAARPERPQPTTPPRDCGQIGSRDAQPRFMVPVSEVLRAQEEPEEPEERKREQKKDKIPRMMQRFVAHGETLVCTRKRALWVEGVDGGGATRRVPLAEVEELL